MKIINEHIQTRTGVHIRNALFNRLDIPTLLRNKAGEAVWNPVDQQVANQTINVELAAVWAGMGLNHDGSVRGNHDSRARRSRAL